MPLTLDFLKYVLNIHWGGDEGGRFASGDQWGFVRYAKIDKKEAAQDWQGITNVATASIDSGGLFGKGSIGVIYGASYAPVGGNPTADPPVKPRPTFVLTGTNRHREGFDQNKPEVIHNIIMASHDGEHWDTVIDEVSLLTATSRAYRDLVWDSGSFFCKTINGAVEGCYKSADGYSWGADGGTFASHCKGVLVGQPDGLYGYDDANDILIWPDWIDGGSGGVKVKKKADDGISYTTSSISFGTETAVDCVAFAGGIWVGGGNTTYSGSLNTACIMTSIDDGKTWNMVSKGALGMHDESGQAPSINAIVGAPATDFS
jgi:hypothetical protein